MFIQSKGGFGHSTGSTKLQSRLVLALDCFFVDIFPPLFVACLHLTQETHKDAKFPSLLYYFRNTHSNAGNSMTSSERAGEGLGDASRTLERNSGNALRERFRVFPEFLPESPRRGMGVWPLLDTSPGASNDSNWSMCTNSLPTHLILSHFKASRALVFPASGWAAILTPPLTASLQQSSGSRGGLAQRIGSESQGKKKHIPSSHRRKFKGKHDRGNRTESL